MKVIWGEKRGRAQGLCWHHWDPQPSQWEKGQSVPSAGFRVISHHLWTFSLEMAFLRDINKE